MLEYSEKPVYRPDIDGLRAIAVLSVIFFHVDKALIPGGFVGVDVFFVISGFLISLHILQEIEAGQFSLLEFYRRRVKRIAPAMLTVVFLTVTVAQIVLIPEDAKRVAGSALWSILSMANVYFWRHLDVSYFAAASSEVPLLHLWSLGVEEQFYVLWPLFLMLAYRRLQARNFVILAAVATGLSFAMAQISYPHHMAFVYYMLPTRAGELLMGALAAMATLKGLDQRLSPTTGDALATAGMVLIAGSLFFLTEEHVFPGFLAIPPTMGTALLILAGHCRKNRVSSWLAAKPLVWVGLVSYSAYLWHWPLLAFYRYGYTDVGHIAGGLIVLATFLLAWLTYRFIEQPARRSRAPAIRVFLRQYVVPSGAITLLALGAIHIDGYGLRWQSEEYKSQFAGLREQTRPAYMFDYVCQREQVKDADTCNTHCVIGTTSEFEPRVILWGDSNAAHYVGVVGAIARQAGFHYRNIELNSCPPLLSDPAPFVLPMRLPDCRNSAAPIRAAVLAADVVIISASWSDYQKRSNTFLNAFFKTTNAMIKAGKQVILIGKAPTIDGYDRHCKEKALSFPFLECPRLALPLTSAVTEVNIALKRYADATPKVAYFDLIPYLCKDGLCSSAAEDGQSLYYDKSHISLPGSWQIGESIVRKDGVPSPFDEVVGWLNNPESFKPAPTAGESEEL